MLTGIVLEPHESLAISSDDLRDCYHTFVVGEARWRRNALNFELAAGACRRWSCFTADLLHAGPLLPCLRTMAMGDHLAVEFAQAAHHGVLRRLCGAMRSAELENGIMSGPSS